jgi:hypothetical protein
MHPSTVELKDLMGTLQSFNHQTTSTFYKQGWKSFNFIMFRMKLFRKFKFNIHFYYKNIQMLQNENMILKLIQ